MVKPNPSINGTEHLGSVGDYYYRNSTGDIYRKISSSSWIVDGNIRGNDGDRWHSGNGAPLGSLGTQGDFYLRRDTNQVYEKTGSSSWTLNFALTDSLGALAALDRVDTPQIFDGAVTQVRTAETAARATVVQGTPRTLGNISFTTSSPANSYVIFTLTIQLQDSSHNFTDVFVRAFDGFNQPADLPWFIRLDPGQVVTTTITFRFKQSNTSGPYRFELEVSGPTGASLVRAASRTQVIEYKK